MNYTRILNQRLKKAGRDYRKGQETEKRELLFREIREVRKEAEETGSFLPWSEAAERLGWSREEEGLICVLWSARGEELTWQEFERLYRELWEEELLTEELPAWYFPLPDGIGLSPVVTGWLEERLPELPEGVELRLPEEKRAYGLETLLKEGEGLFTLAGQQRESGPERLCLCIAGEPGSGRTFAMEEMARRQGMSLLLADGDTFRGTARELNTCVLCARLYDAFFCITLGEEQRKGLLRRTEDCFSFYGIIRDRKRSLTEDQEAAVVTRILERPGRSLKLRMAEEVLGELTERLPEGLSRELLTGRQLPTGAFLQYLKTLRAELLLGTGEEKSRKLPEESGQLQLLKGRRTFEELKLPKVQHEKLQEICRMTAARGQVLEQWGFDRKFSYGNGISVLFYGAPGTGKTMRAMEVLADEVAWEYLSRTGWKPLFREEHRRSMFNGSSEGAVVLDFICPEDMADYEENQEGRIRLRLMRAENIYRMPALYKCPVISGLQLSYSYEEGQAKPSRILTGNNFDLQDLTECLQTGGSGLLFYETEGRQRTMYLGFDRPMSGLPLSLYFDIENYGDRPVRFRAEYLTEQGFQPVRMEDCTEGFGGSGNLLLMVPQDTVKKKLYGYEGYFLRFVCLDSDYAEYELPVIRGIYPNMAAVINVNTETEEFYLENREEAAQFQLSRQNLLNIRVEVLEQQNGMSGYVEWQRESHPYEGGRTYGVDMASGELTFRKYAFVNVPVPEEGPQIRVFHSNYSGREANLPAGSITVPGTAIRYLSAVTNPFPTCGGYDGYTEETAGRLVSGLLRTRGRAVTEEGYLDLISQEACGVRKIKCCNHTDARGRTAPDKMTIAVLVEEYEKGAHVFSAVKKQIRDRLVRDSALTAAGKELLLIQPHFIRVNVRVWLERETMEQAYELQQQTLELIRRFLNPLEGGSAGQGWEIGELPEVSRLRAFLRAGLEGCSITKMVMTAVADGREVPMDALFYKKQTDPFVMAVSGEHMVYIEVSAC